MKKAEELYPYESECYDYQPMLNSFGTVAVQVDDSDYQGDSRVLYHNPDGRLGYLQFGWGSCSGCDALQSCSTYAEINALMDQLRDQIRWFETREEALKFFTEHDWEGDYDGNTQRNNEFVTKCLAYLNQ